MEIAPASEADLESAVAVWRAANIARDQSPNDQRVARVGAKLRDPDAVVLVARDDDVVVGMLQAEPGRSDRGTGDVVPDVGHVSMVFVDPARWGSGIGRYLMAGVAEAAIGRGWVRLSLWTRDANERARRLYEAAGYQLTGDKSDLHGALIVRYRRVIVSE